MTSETWGPWVEHDGKGCPCVGAWAQWELEKAAVGSEFRGTSGTIIENCDHSAIIEGVARRQGLAWTWEYFGQRGPYGGFVGRIIRYRIRRFSAEDTLAAIARAPRKAKIGEPA